MVREDQVLPATVKVEAFAKQGERHDHALGVPTGPPRAPGRRPAGLAGFAFFQRAKSSGERFSSFDLHPGPRAQRVEALVGEQPVVGDRPRP